MVGYGSRKKWIIITSNFKPSEAITNFNKQQFGNRFTMITFDLEFNHNSEDDNI